MTNSKNIAVEVFMKIPQNTSIDMFEVEDKLKSLGEIVEIKYNDPQTHWWNYYIYIPSKLDKNNLGVGYLSQSLTGELVTNPESGFAFVDTESLHSWAEEIGLNPENYEVHGNYLNVRFPS